MILRIFYKIIKFALFKHCNKYKKRTYLQLLWNQRRKLHYLQLAIRKVICRKLYLKKQQNIN